MIRDLLARWEADAALLESVAGAGQAAVFRRCARELEAEMEAEGQEALTLEAAGKESGYHKDSLTRLMRKGKIPNVGKPHAPLIRRADLPRKASDLTPASLMRIIPRNRRSS